MEVLIPDVRVALTPPPAQHRAADVALLRLRFYIAQCPLVSEARCTLSAKWLSPAGSLRKEAAAVERI